MHQRAGFSNPLVLLLAIAMPAIAGAQDVVTLDASAPAHPFPHYWEHVFGSGRAALSLRDSYRRDLHALTSITAAGYVRFHGIFHDELGVYDEDKEGRPIYNFSYIDQIYDGLLASGVRPIVELGFMPQKLALKPMLHPFWYKPDISPPKSYARWDELITEFAGHLIARYGIDEVSRWYFEVWNEPNLDFWGGDPRQDTYWELYDHTARALKAVHVRLRVGGPATAQAAWVTEFIRHSVENRIPVDFVSSHVYANDTSENVFGTHEPVPRDQMVCRAVRKVHDEIKASPLPTLPLIWSEFNASYSNEPDVTDAVYMGPWLAETVSQCDGLVDEMSYWTFSDVFEEQGVVKTPFYGGFGLLSAGGIPKPAYNAFALLHQLGDSRFESSAQGALLTRTAKGALVVALWNYAPPDAAGSPRKVTLRLKGRAARTASVARVDADHGDVHAAYRTMGSPRYPTQRQLEELKRAAALPAPTVYPLRGGKLTLDIPPHGLALVTIN
jgi:xylan 1,4-beta-xylosidase